MKISNFSIDRTLGSSPLNLRYYGSIDVTTGIFFKKTKRREIYREYITSWIFLDNSEFCPNGIRNMERVWRAVNEIFEP